MIFLRSLRCKKNIRKRKTSQENKERVDHRFCSVIQCFVFCHLIETVILIKYLLKRRFDHFSVKHQPFLSDIDRETITCSMHVGRMVPTNLETNCNAHGPQPRRFFPFLFVVFSFSFHVFFYYYSLFLSCLTTSFHHLFVYRHFFSLACAVCLSFFLALCLRILKLLFFRFCVCVCFSVT